MVSLPRATSPPSFLEVPRVNTTMLTLGCRRSAHSSAPGRISSCTLSVVCTSQARNGGCDSVGPAGKVTESGGARPRVPTGGGQSLRGSLMLLCLQGPPAALRPQHSARSPLQGVPGRWAVSAAIRGPTPVAWPSATGDIWKLQHFLLQMTSRFSAADHLATRKTVKAKLPVTLFSLKRKRVN